MELFNTMAHKIANQCDLQASEVIELLKENGISIADIDTIAQEIITLSNKQFSVNLISKEIKKINLQTQMHRFGGYA